MNKVLIIIVTLCACFMVPKISYARETLTIMGWSKYHPPSIIARFEKETGITVKFESLNSTESMEALLALKKDGFDLAMPREYSVAGLIEDGLIERLDKSKLPNLKNLEPRFVNTPHDPGCNYSIPYLVGTIGILSRENIREPYLAASWGYLLDPSFNASSFALLNNYRETLGLTLKFKRHSLNSKNNNELEEAAQVLMDLNNRPTFLGYMDYDYAQNRLLAETVDNIVTYNGEAASLMAKNPGYKFLIPVEGSIIAVDNYVINRHSKHIDAAHKWLNYLMDPEIAAIIADKTMFASPNYEAKKLIYSANLNNPTIYPPRQVLESLEFGADLSPGIKKNYQDAWSRVSHK